MRKQFVSTVEALLDKDPRLTVLLGDIGVFGFSEAFSKHPERIYNIGILEQSTIGLAAGLAKTGFIPVVHTIAPFLVERAYEQLKLDFGYQHLGGNFVSVGGSYDYASLGCTHHCPGDVAILSQIPGMQIVVPGTAVEFDHLFRESYNNGSPTYFRLSERSNQTSHPNAFGKATILKKGSTATMVVVGTMLDVALEAAIDLDISIFYTPTVVPFDADSLTSLPGNSKILLVEPYYSGVLVNTLCGILFPKPVVIDTVGIPREFLHSYGHAHQHDADLGLTSEAIRIKLIRLINE